MTGFAKARVTVHLDDGSEFTGLILKGDIIGPKTMQACAFGDGTTEIVVEPARAVLEIINLQVVDREPITITPPKPPRLPADAEDPNWGRF